MRKLKVYAEGADSQVDHSLSIQQMRKNNKFKNVLKDCQEVICQLQRQNQKLQLQVKQKDAIVAKLIEQKQSHILHMASCNSEQLQDKLWNAQQKQKQMNASFKEMAERYERIIAKNMTQIQKLKSYNRALRVENTHLRELQDSEDKRKRKIGTISCSSRKAKQSTNSFKETQINTNNEEEVRQKSFEVFYHTPQNLKSLKSAALPSTNHSKAQPGFTQERLWKSKQTQKSLFQNQFLRKVGMEKPDQTKNSESQSKRQQQINRVIKRVKQILASSDDE